MKLLLTGTRGYRPGFIAGNFLRLYGDKYTIVEYEGDIRNWPRKNSSYWKEFDFVIHLAAMAGVRRSHEEPQLFWDVNVDASQRIFDAMNNEVPVIYASSSSIYEWWLSPYATTKYAMERIAPYHSLGLRFHTVYGPNSRTDMLYDMLLKRDVKYITNHTRDWTHVFDVCSAIDTCIQNYNRINVHAMDVGNGLPVSVKEMADHLWPDNKLPVVEVTGEREHTCADPAVLQSLGWVSQHHVLDEL